MTNLRDKQCSIRSNKSNRNHEIMCRCCAWVQKRVVITEAQTHGPGRSIPMFKSQVQRPLGYPGARVSM